MSGRYGFLPVFLLALSTVHSETFCRNAPWLDILLESRESEWESSTHVVDASREQALTLCAWERTAEVCRGLWRLVCHYKKIIFIFCCF